MAKPIFRLRQAGLVAMGTDGEWHLTEEGHDLRGMLDIVLTLDRPGTAEACAPQAEATPGGQRPGDDGRTRRGRRRG